MPTLARRGSGTPVDNGVTTWASKTNAVDGTPGTNPATYATWTNSTSGAVGYIEVSGYNFSDTIGASDTINSVTITLRGLVGNTGRISAANFQPYDGSTAIGSPFAFTHTTAAANYSTTFAVTLAQLRSANFKVRATYTHAGNSQSLVVSLDHIDVTADYSPPPQTWTGGSEGGVGFAGASGDFSEFIPVGGKFKVWTGSAWEEKPVKVWTGSAWEEKPLKVWTGSEWVLS